MAFCLVVMGGVAEAQGLLLENFVYSTGQLTNFGGGANVSGGNWVIFSDTANFIQVGRN